MRDTSETIHAPSEPGNEVDAVSPSSRRSQIGARIDRYVVISVLGAGAMGVVYAAYDPELDRKIALKLLKQRGKVGSRNHARFQREARALAKLDHRNVVGIHDVGVHEGQLFIAMEFVAGRTLREWMGREPPPPWREILATFVAAGRGLAAAHGAGLIHRDFKPDNIMIGDDGRVRVMDFGLARAADDDEAESTLPKLITGETGAEGEASLLRRRLTQTGALLGTPAYMAPEQLTATAADARADQFAFCVALYEALYGERPFVASSIAELVRAIERGAVHEPPPQSKVPPWVRRVLLRGLAGDPARRWPSMAALLEALADDPTPRRRRRVAATLAAALVAGGGWSIATAVRTDAEVCTHAADKLEGSWDDERRAALEQAMLGTEVAYAPQTWAKVEVLLDDYAQAWVGARIDACEATRRGEQSGELLDLRMACLDERLLHLHATVDELAQADADMVQHAVEAVLALPTLDRCADADALLAEIPPPDDPTVAAKVARLEQRLIEVRAKYELGSYEQARGQIDAMVEEAGALDYEPLTAQLWLLQGQLQSEQADYEGAKATLERALEAALVSGMMPEAAKAATDLIYVVGYRLARYEDGQRWAKLADMLSRAADTPLARADWRSRQGVLERAQGADEAARADNERALAILEQVHGPDHPAVGSVLVSLGILSRSMGEHEDARAYLERALAIVEQTLGADHPKRASVLNTLATVDQIQGRNDEARLHLEQAIAINEKALGADHPKIATSLNLLAVIAASEGDLEGARAHFESALEIRERVHGPDHPEVAGMLTNLGILMSEAKRYPEARDYLERGLATLERLPGTSPRDLTFPLITLGAVAMEEGDLAQARDYIERARGILEGSGHPQLADVLVQLGELAAREGELEDAIAYYERALVIQREVLGEDHPQLALALTRSGLAWLELEQPEKAIPPLERALALRSARALDPFDLAQTRFALARALWWAPSDRGGDRPRARQLAESALEAYTEGGERAASEREEVEAWLAEHPR